MQVTNQILQSLVYKVLGITNDTIKVKLLGTEPVAGDYILFVKNEIVNTSNLSGYYADVKFENDSLVKAELFSVSSEVSESSK